MSTRNPYPGPMPLITGPLKWYTLAADLEAAAYAGFTEKPARHGVVPGAIAWDACDCGLLAVSLNQVYLSDVFPDPISSLSGIRCDAAYEVGEYVLQILRCAPQPQGENLAPTVAELDASAQETLRDLYELLRSISVELCQLEGAGSILSHVLRPATAQGPSGACTGWELRALVALGRN